jgi:hypothetical protein
MAKTLNLTHRKKIERKRRREHRIWHIVEGIVQRKRAACAGLTLLERMALRTDEWKATLAERDELRSLGYRPAA